MEDTTYDDSGQWNSEWLWNVVKNKVDLPDRQSFLCKISEQLRSDQYGFFRKVLLRSRQYGVSDNETWQVYAGMKSEEKVSFLFHLTDALQASGLAQEGAALLEAHESAVGYERWKATRSKLETIDPEWHERASVHALSDGVQVEYGRFRNDEPFSISIILRDGSYGRNEET